MGIIIRRSRTFTMPNQVKDVMTKNPMTVFKDDSLSKIIYSMSSYHIDHLPVVDKSKKLIGVLSKTDMYQKAMNLAQKTSGSSYNNMILENSTAEEIMTKEPVSVSPEDSVSLAIKLLLKGNFHALPVVENNVVVGIISSQDIMENMLQKD